MSQRREITAALRSPRTRPEETRRRIDDLRVVHSHHAVLRDGKAIGRSTKYEDIPALEQPLRAAIR